MPYSNTPSFRLASYHGEDGRTGYRVVPFVDGTSLVDLIAEYEREQNYHLPGSYAGHDGLDVRGRARWVFGVDEPGGSTRELLVCGTCFNSECWPLMARVEVGHGHGHVDGLRPALSSQADLWKRSDPSCSIARCTSHEWPLQRSSCATATTTKTEPCLIRHEPLDRDDRETTRSALNVTGRPSCAG